MIVEPHVALQPYNSFGISARARALVRVRSLADVQAVVADAGLRDQGLFVLGEASHIGKVRKVTLLISDERGQEQRQVFQLLGPGATP